MLSRGVDPISSSTGPLADEAEPEQTPMMIVFYYERTKIDPRRLSLFFTLSRSRRIGLIFCGKRDKYSL